MPKQNKILLYSEDAVVEALNSIKEGSSIKAASEKYGVPYSTLFYKHSGKNPIAKKMGPSSILTVQEEKVLVDWILHLSATGFPVTRDQLLDSVELLIKKLKRHTPFKNNRPGRHWYESFMKRHPELSMRTPQNLTQSRSALSEQKIRSWFQEVETYLKQNSCFDVVNEPSRIFNTDESAFFLNPKESKVIVKRGEKTVYNFVGNDEKECLTTLITGNAAGDLGPPMVVFSYERIPAYVANKIPNNWAVGKSDSGWMTGETFFEYVSNVFHPWLIEKKIQRPIILYVDGHRSHLTLALSDFCTENGIILVALYPNATHILQPMDVAVFHPLKNGWKKEVRKWKIENEGKKVAREHFCIILERALGQYIRKETLINGFRSCGLFPFDANAINYQKFFKNQSIEKSKDNHPINDQEKVTLLNQLEKEIGMSKVSLFKDSEGIWQGAVEDTSLFYLWKKIKMQASNNVSQGEDEVLFDGSLSVNNEGDLILEGDWLEQYVDNQENESLVSQGNEPLLEGQQENELELPTLVVDKLLKTRETENPSLEATESSEITLKDVAQQISELEVLEKRCEEQKKQEVLDEVNLSRHETESQLETPPIERTPEEKKIPANIPSPFKTTLFWPEPPKVLKNKKSKDKIPTVATSQQWKEYHKKKNEEKKKKEDEIKERKRKREEKAHASVKKQKNLQKCPKNGSSSQETESTELVISQGQMESQATIAFQKDQHVIVRYNEEYYPGKVLAVSEEQVQVSVMTRSGCSSWKWPNVPDILWYEKEEVLKHIHSPRKINNRGVYLVSEMRDYEEFINC